jgi:hypothetical protein
MQISESDLRGIVRDEMMRTGVSRRIREAAAAPAAGGNLAYKVKQGDTISAVLQTYYGIPLGKANYPLYNQVAKLSGIANADKILAQGDVLQLPPTLGGKPRKGAAAPAAGAPAAKGKQCNLPSYKDSLPAALGKAGIAGMAMTATIALIISGKFYNASAAGLKAIADKLRTGGQSALGALAGVAAQFASFGGSEFLKNVVIGLCDGFSGIISGCVNAITKFSRTCDFKTFGAEVGRAFGLGFDAMLSGVKGGIGAVLSFLQTGAQALGGLLASAGLAALGITAAVVTGLINGFAGLIRAGAAAIQAAISTAIVAAGTALAGAGAAVSAAGAGMQAAGAATVQAGQAMRESRNRRGHRSNNVVQKLANDMLHAATINRYLISLDESTRAAVLASVI